MRTIKFRGLRKDGNGWVYGDLLTNEICGPFIVDKEGTYIKVLPATVGQYIGLNDRMGKEVHEGDVVEMGYGDTFNVIYEKGAFTGTMDGWTIFGGIMPPSKNIAVIGNIHHPSCNSSCGPGDYRKGGKCDRMGCFKV